MNIVCCYIVNHRELGPAAALARWIAELGGVKSHECLLCLTKPAQRIGAEDQLRPLLEQAFGSVTTFVPHDEVEIPWPNEKVDARSPNHMFKRVSQEMEYHVKKPWLWLEMDAVPVKASWLNDLGQEYERGARPFMGVKLDAGGRPYMSGIAVYPANITVSTPHLRNPGLNQLGGQVPFDVYGGIDTVRLGHFTDLIQYVKPNPGGYADWSVSHDEILPRTALFHRSKDLALIEFLRGTSANVPHGTLNGRTPEAEPSISLARVPPNIFGDGHKIIPPHSTVSLVHQSFEDMMRYHVCALGGLAATPEKRKEIIGMLRIAGLAAERAPSTVWDGPLTRTYSERLDGPVVPEKPKRKRGKSAKIKKPVSQKVLDSLAASRAKLAAKRAAAKEAVTA